MSKKVFLRRKDLGGHLPKAVRAEAISRLSSVYVNRQPLKGFTPTEEKKYMQEILDVSPAHVDWPKHSKAFWAELSIPVGFTGVDSIRLKKDADKEFIKVSSNLDNMKRILRLMSNSNPARMTEDQIENSLYEIKNSDPKRFITIATDKNLEMKAEIEEMISAGVLRKIGNQIIFIDEVLGDTTEDTIVHLKDKKNSGKLTILRAKLKELSLI